MFGRNQDKVEEILAKTCSMIRRSRDFKRWLRSERRKAGDRQEAENFARVRMRPVSKRNVLKDKRFGGHGYMTRTLPVERLHEIMAARERQETERHRVNNQQGGPLA